MINKIDTVVKTMAVRITVGPTRLLSRDELDVFLPLMPLGLTGQLRKGAPFATRSGFAPFAPLTDRERLLAIVNREIGLLVTLTLRLLANGATIDRVIEREGQLTARQAFRAR